MEDACSYPHFVLELQPENKEVKEFNWWERGFPRFKNEPKYIFGIDPITEGKNSSVLINKFYPITSEEAFISLKSSKKSNSLSSQIHSINSVNINLKKSKTNKLKTI